MTRREPVVVFPARERDEELFFIRKYDGTLTLGGFAREDDTFTAKEEVLGQWEALAFLDADSAIGWAEDAPRNWQVINKFQFGSSLIPWPDKLVVRVVHTIFSPFPHKTVEKRQVQGENVTELEIDFELLQWDPPDKQLPPLKHCRILIDPDTRKLLLTPLGIDKPIDLNGKIIELQPDDPNEIFRPLRIVFVYQPLQFSQCPRTESMAQIYDMMKHGNLIEVGEALNQITRDSTDIATLAFTWKCSEDLLRNDFSKLYYMLGNCYENAASQAQDSGDEAVMAVALREAERSYDKALDVTEMSPEDVLLLPHQPDSHFPALFYHLGMIKYFLSKQPESKHYLAICLQYPAQDQSTWQMQQMARCVYEAELQ